MGITKTLGWSLLALSLGVHVWRSLGDDPEAQARPQPAEARDPARKPAEPEPRERPRPVRTEIKVVEVAVDASTLLEELEGAERSRERVEIIERLGALRATEAVAVLAELAEGTDDDAALAATQALGRIGGEIATEVLIGLAETAGKGIQGAAARALGAARTLEARRWLFEAAGRDAAVAGDALVGIGELADPEAERFLAGVLWQARPRHGAVAAHALARAQTPAARAALGRAARGAPSMEVRVAAVRAVGEIAGPEERALLVDLARSNDPELGPAAVDALAAQRDPEVLELLVELITGGHRNVASSAVWAISRYPAEEARPTLIDLLSEAPSEVAWVLTQAVAELGDPDARDALLALLDGPRTWAQAALASLDRLPFDEAVEAALTRTIGAGDPYLSGVALQTLARRAGEGALPWLRQAYRHSGQIVRHHVLAALASIRGREADAWMEELATSGPFDLRGQALQMMSQRPGPGRERALDLMLHALEKPGRNWNLGYALAQMHDPRATQALLEQVKKRPSGRAMELVQAIATSGDEAAIAELVEQIRTTPEGIKKTQLIGALGGSQDEQALGYLSEVAEQEGPLGLQALQALTYTGRGQETTELARRAAQSSDPERRAAGVNMLAQSGGPLALEAATAALADSNQGVRYAALQALQQVGSEEAAQVLTKHYRTTRNSQEKSALLSSLVTSGGEEGLAIAEEALRGKDEVLSTQAINALLYGQDGAGADLLARIAEGQDPLAARVRGHLQVAGHLHGTADDSIIEPSYDSLGRFVDFVGSLMP
jgi:HEAT repeat protein